MPFGLALRRWIESFRRLGIQFRGATMQLDLLERTGKHQNGFCHGPVPTWIDEDGRWVPSAINFTAEAKPDQVGSGLRAINTLVPRRRPRRALRQRRPELALLLAGIRADVDGVRGDAVDVLRFS